MYIAGIAWVSENVHEYLDGAAIIAIAVCVFVLLPCALFRATYQISAYGLFISSVIFGAATWILGFLVTLQYWGAFGVFVGVIMGLVGIVPLGMLASAFHSDWSAVSQLAFGFALTYGARMTAVMLAGQIDRDDASITSNSWVIAGVVAGVIAVGALSGGVALSPSNGAATNISKSRRAESVYVKYRGEVDLKSFDCKDITRSSFINRVCYDEANEYMLINLNGTYYHYCAIDDGTVSALLAADSMGRFYNASIKGNFDCRKNPVPEYPQDRGVTAKSDDLSTAPPQANPPSRDDHSAAPTPDANMPAAIPGGATPTTNARESSPFDGRWSATVGPQGGCNFTSTLTLDVVSSSIVGNATNPLGVFPLSGRFAIGSKRTAGNLN